MPNYKKRRIELIPNRRTDWTWQCSYIIIEFRPTCWAYHKGCSDKSFASHQEAATAALEEAKGIVDSLEPLSQAPLSGSVLVLGIYWNRIRRLLFSFVAGIGMIVPRSMFVRRYVTKS